MPKLSVVIVTGIALEGLKLCVKSILEHTKHEGLELVLIFCNATKETLDWAKAQSADLDGAKLSMAPTAGADVYECYNMGVAAARGEIVCLLNDDMVVAEGWADFALANMKPKVYTTGVVVEPGHVGISTMNISYDCGMGPADFDAEKFATVAKGVRKQEMVPGGHGWYMPVMFYRKDFMEFGGYPHERPFPAPNDILFLDHTWIGRGGARQQSRDMVVYHFQRLSQRGKKSLYVGLQYRDGFDNVIIGEDERTSGQKAWLDFIYGGGCPNEYEHVLLDGALDYFYATEHELVIGNACAALRTGGTLACEFDALDDACKAFLADPKFEGPVERIFGKPGEWKSSGVTTARIESLLAAHGMKDVKTVPGHTRQFRTEATKA